MYYKLTLLIFISLAYIECIYAVKCDPTLCQRVRCIGVDPKKCEKSGGVYLAPNPLVCRCCPQCLKKLGINFEF